MFVRNWMSAPVRVIPSSVPVEAAMALMEKRQVRRLPVVDGGWLVGIVTRSDLEASLGRGKELRNGTSRTVLDIMTRHPVTVAPDDTLEHVAQLMRDKKLSGLPVLDQERIVGIITESDVFRALCEIMGVGERGARVVMNVRDDENLLEKIGKRLSGLAMQSLVTIHDSERGCWDVVLRVRGRVPARKAN